MNLIQELPQLSKESENTSIEMNMAKIEQGDLIHIAIDLEEEANFRLIATFVSKNRFEKETKKNTVIGTYTVPIIVADEAFTVSQLIKNCETYEEVEQRIETGIREWHKYLKR